MPLSHYAAALALASSFQLCVAEQCNAAIATPQSEYAGTFTWQGRTMTVGPIASSRTATGNFQATATPTGGSSSSSSNIDATNSWLDWGHDAVNSLASRKVKRQGSEDTLECLDAQICMNNEGGVPFCLDERTGGWHGATGYEGNSVTGNYTAPDGTKGNVYLGPCPGAYYTEASRGCAIVPAEQRAEESATPSSSGSPSSSAQGSAVTETDSAAVGLWRKGEVGALLAGAVLVAGFV